MDRVNRMGMVRVVVVLALSSLPWVGGCEGGPPSEGGSAAEPMEGPGEIDPDRMEVTRLAYEFMDALSRRDTARLGEMMAPHARLFSIREGEEGAEYRVRTREEFLEGLGEDGPRFVERIWDPVVEMKGRIGMVWAPYDFHVDGEMTHCGIDVLAFLKMEEGWRVTSITYNMVRDDCPISPLGSPEK